MQLILLKHLQLAGHRALALVGGATGLIGDPRMSGERVLNSPEVVASWVQRLQTQISKFLDFDGDNPAKMVNNLDWTQELSAIDFLRDVGKHYRLGTMLAKETVARRLASEEGISFTEFSYQILQGNDFKELFEREGCTLQTGGNDQWGNLLSGVELIRRTHHQPVHALTTPLITKADGTKFGKSEGGAVWLDPQMMSAYAFYQFWVNTDDADVIRFIKIFTFASREQVAELIQQVQDAPHARVAQKFLAGEVTALVHGPQAVQQAISASQSLFGRGELAELSLETLTGALAELPRAEVAQGASVVDALVVSGLVASRGAARRAISEGGVYVNNQRISDEEHVLGDQDFLHGQFAVLRRGKRTLAAVVKTA